MRIKQLRNFLFQFILIVICYFSAEAAFAAQTDATAASAPTGTGAAASVPTDTTSMIPDISSLEKRFFEHTFPQDTVDARISRLEHMVFGETRSGSDRDRLTALLVAVPEEPAAAPTPTAAAPSTGNPTADSADQSANVPPANSDDVADSSDYPRITQLEQEIEGKSFPQEPVQKRLAQLETKAFGKPSSSEDLSSRTDALEKYADKHFHHERGGYPDTAYDGESPPNGAAPAGYPSYPPMQQAANLLPPTASLDQKVSWLEQQVFGQVHTNEPLLDRVNQLETNLFPANSPERTTDLAEQVNSMVGAVELMPQHAGTPVAQGPTATAYQPPQYGESPQYGQPQQPPQYGQAPYQPPQYNEAPQYGQSPYGQQSNFDSAANSAQQSQVAQNHHSSGHPLIRGLAHVLGSVGSMAASSMMMGGMGGYGMW